MGSGISSSMESDRSELIPFLSVPKLQSLKAAFAAAWLAAPCASNISVALHSDVRSATITGASPAEMELSSKIGRYRMGWEVRVEILDRHLVQRGESVSDCLVELIKDIGTLRAEAAAFLETTRQQEAFDAANVGERFDGMG